MLTRPIARLWLLTLIAAMAALVLAPPSRAQAAQYGQECTAADLDASFGFVKAVGSEWVILQLRNISGGACLLHNGVTSWDALFINVTLGRGGAYAGANIWTRECIECDSNGKPNPRPYTRAFVLQPGDRAQKRYQWATESTDPNTPCQNADGLSMTVNTDVTHTLEVVAPLLITKVCSTVQVSAYGPLGSDEEDEPTNTEEPGAESSLRLTTDKSDNIVGELIVLHVSADRAGLLDRDSCPVLFFRVRAEDGVTRFMQDVRFRGCKETPDSQDGTFTEDLILNNPFGMDHAGQYSLELAEVVGQPAEGRARLVTSAPTPLRFSDATTLKRTWIPQVRGLSLALNLDGETYALGQDVHLHAVVEDFDATGTIYRSDCSRAVTFEVHDAAGNLVKQKEAITPGYPTFQFMTCHLGMSFAFPKGEPFPMESTLREWGILPDAVGEYTVTATWNALSECQAPPPPDALGRCLEPYAVIKSQPVRFRITAIKN